MKEESFPQPGKPLHRWGGQPGQKWSFRGSKQSTADSLWQADQRETCTDGPGHCPVLPSLRCATAGAGGTSVLKLGFQRTDPRREPGLAAQRKPEGAGAWYGLQPGVYVEEAQVHHRSKALLLRSMEAGDRPVAVFLHTLSADSPLPVGALGACQRAAHMQRRG